MIRPPRRPEQPAAEEARRPDDLGWFLSDFVQRQPDVSHAIVVSADGVLIASSDRLPPSRGEQLAAITSGLVSLTEAAARSMDAGKVIQTSVDMDLGYLFLMSMSHGAYIAVLASPDCELGLIAYEMTGLVVRVGKRLTPEMRGVQPQ